jgi:hypothetical protein
MPIDILPSQIVPEIDPSALLGIPESQDLVCQPIIFISKIEIQSQKNTDSQVKETIN